MQKWAEKDDDFSKRVAPTEKCEKSDFSDISPDVKISSPGSGETISGDSFTISASGSSDFGIDKITVYVNGLKLDHKTVRQSVGAILYQLTSAALIWKSKPPLKAAMATPNQPASRYTLRQ